jgi:hypothetical protein
VSRKDVEGERLKGRSFNRVVGITIRTSQLKTFSWFWRLCRLGTLCRDPLQQVKDKQYTLRLPRVSTKNMQYDIAMLRVVGARLNVPVPCVEHYVASEDNIVGSPYILQPRLLRKNLSLVVHEMTSAQLRSLARQVTHVVLKITSLQSEAGGLVINATDVYDSFSPGFLDKPEVCGPGITRSDPDSATVQTPLNFLLEQCDRWTQADNIYGDIFSRLAKVARGLHAKGFLDERDLC